MIQFGLAVLFTSLWVGLLLALAVHGAFWLMPRTNATTRYAAWTLALMASVVMSVAITLSHLSTAGPAAPPATTVSQVAHTYTTSHATVTEPARRQSITTVPANAAPAPRVHLSVPALLAPLPFVLWALVAIAILARLTIALAQLEALKRDALPVPIDVRDGLSAWSQANKGDRGVRLCTSERVTVPVAVGLFDSLILVPARLLDSLSHRELDQILLHELAHLRRADDWTNCFQRVIEALFFFNPAMLWMARKLDIEREVACDDWVVTQTRDVRPYALCLTHMAEVTAWPHRALAAPGVFITRKSLSIRVERLLAAGRNIGTSIALGPAGIVAAAIVVLVFVAQTVAPSIAFTLPSPPVPATPPQHLAAVPATPKSPPTTAAPKLGVKAVSQLVTPPHPVALATRASEHLAIPARLAAPPVAARFAHLHTAHIDNQVRALSNLYVKRALAQLPPGAAVNAPSAVVASGFNCIGCDLGGVRWAGRDFRGANLSGSQFTNADLRNADFSGANLSGVDFQGANLSGVNFERANLAGANLRDANITGANLDDANLSGADVDVSHLSTSQARTLLVRCKGCDFAGADLHDQDLHGLTLTGVDLQGANLSGADLSGARFSGVDLNRATLAGARLTNATFVGCDFSGVDLRNVDLSQTHISGSDLSSAILR